MHDIDQLSDGFDLGPFQVFPRKEQIVGPEATHHLEPKVMQVLVMLASNAQQPVTRNELLESVWSGTVVGDEVLSRAVSLLRGYFKDERTNPTFIRTLPKQGYELVQPVTPIAERHAPSLTRSYLLAGLLAGLVLAIGVTIYWFSRPAPPPTIAVLPFQIPEELQQIAYISESLTDELTTHLSTSSKVRVVARRSSFAYRDPQIDASAIGDLLGATHLVEGSIYQAEGSSLNAVVYLVEVESGTNVWSAQIEADNPTALRERVVAATLQAINDETSAQVGELLATSPVNPDALRAYFEARYQWSLRGELRIDRALSLLKEAIELEPNFGAAHLALAHALVVQPFYSTTNLSVPAGFELARASAARAVEADSTLGAEVTALEGFMLMRQRLWNESLAALEQALALDSESVLANYWYSMLLCNLGRPQDALAYAEKASRLDPTSPVLNDRLAITYLWVDDLAAATNRYDIANKLGYLESNNPKSLFVFLNRAKRFEALSELLLRLGNDPRWVLPFIAGLENVEQRDSAKLALEAAITEGIVPKELRFGAWVFLEDADRAIRDFDHDLKTDDIELLWASESAMLREHPKFPELLDKLGLSSVL